MIETGSAASGGTLAALAAAAFPVLEDRGRVIPEATIIIEYLAVHYPGPVRLIPSIRCRHRGAADGWSSTITS